MAREFYLAMRQMVGRSEHLGNHSCRDKEKKKKLERERNVDDSKQEILRMFLFELLETDFDPYGATTP